MGTGCEYGTGEGRLSGMVCADFFVDSSRCPSVGREYHLLLQEGTLLDWSYRLTVALALLHLRLDLTSPASEEASLAPWLALVQGEREEVSGQNRSASLRSLREICLGIEEDSREALEKLDQVAATNGDALLDMVKALWKGETTATQQLRQTLDRQLNVRHA